MAPTDRDALLVLYRSTNGPNWKNNTNWDTDADLSEWYGVKLNGEGRAVKLCLGSNNLRGPIPPELEDLDALQELSLHGNQLTGTIPEELGKLVALEILRLERNILSGPIPKELGALSELSTLWLGYNSLTGTVPRELTNLRNLVFLDLSGNRLVDCGPAIGPLPPTHHGMDRLDWGATPTEAPPRGARRLFSPLGRLWSRVAVRLGMRQARQEVNKPRQEMSPREEGGHSFHTDTGKGRLRRFSEGKTATTPDPPAYDVKDATRGEYGLGDAALAPEWPRPDNPASPIRVERREQGDQLGGGKDAAKSAPPQLQQILPLMLTFLESRSWCHCLSVSPSARDAVRAVFAGLMPDGPRPEEGWTVPLDVLTLKTDDAGVAHLAANECGITIHGAAGNLAHLKAVIVPPPHSGFVSVEGEQYIATSPILRCRWTGNNCSQGPWTVSFPLEEEDGLSNPTELSQVLRRGDELQDEWEVQTAGLKAATRHPSMQVEVTHFSDVMTADKLREIEEKCTSIVYERKRAWGTTVSGDRLVAGALVDDLVCSERLLETQGLADSVGDLNTYFATKFPPVYPGKQNRMFSRHVHVYNASSKAMTVLQILPTVTESGRSGQVSLPVVGGGAGGSRSIYINDDNGVNDWQVIAAWANASGGKEPPTNPAKLRTLFGMRAMRVIPYTVTGSRETNNLKVFPRHIFECLAGYDYYLLQKMTDESGRSRFLEEDVDGNMSEERTVLDIVNRRKTS